MPFGANDSCRCLALDGRQQWPATITTKVYRRANLGYRSCQADRPQTLILALSELLRTPEL